MNFEALNALITAHPFCIPVYAVAEFLHIGEESLRASMDQCRCPFGFSWKLGERSGYKIPTIAFVSWLTKGTFTPTSPT